MKMINFAIFAIILGRYLRVKNEIGILKILDLDAEGSGFDADRGESDIVGTGEGGNQNDFSYYEMGDQ